MKRWSVRKRDGVWVVFDHRGKLRYTAASWRMAVTFALMCGQPLPPPGYGPWETYLGGVDHRHPALNWPELYRKLREKYGDQIGDEQ